jgi:hypothetical protein
MVLKTKKVSHKSAKAKAWKAFSDYIRLRDSLRTTGSPDSCRCITCEKIVPYSSIQAGHFVGGRGGAVLFDEESVWGQCIGCNVFLRGNYQLYTLKMISLYGMERVEELLAMKKQSKQYKTFELLEIAKKYKSLYESLKEAL